MKIQGSTLSMLALTSLIGVHANAAETPEPAEAADATLEEVVVTAQFREQSLQDTPIAITAMSAAMMESRSQTSIQDVANQAP
ncbi:MAG: TonB-dependent receptor, partial [Steroidobacteraceae bacterium]